MGFFFRMQYKQKGFSLLEVMIALLVFSVGIMAVASLQIASLNSVARTRKGLYDSVGAADQLERIISMPFNDPLLIDTDNDFAPQNPDHGPFPLISTGSTIEWEVEDNFPVAGTKRIRITVQYRGRRGTKQIFTYDYVKAKDFS